MNLSQNVFKSSETWNESLLQETTLNVVSYLMKGNFKSIKLRLLVPYRRKRLFQISEEEQQKIIKESDAHMRYVDSQAELIVPLIFQILKKTINANKANFKTIPNCIELTTQRFSLYEEDWVSSVSKMFGSIEEDINSSKEEKVHVIYIIDSSVIKGIPYESGIPFVNYIVF